MFGDQLAESSVRSSHISAHINKPPQSTEPSASKPVVDDLSDFAGGAVRGGLPYEVEDADPGAALIYTGDFVAGLIGGSVGVALGHPFDTLKTRQQILGGSLANCVCTTIRNDGPKGFFKGLAFPLGAVGGLNAIFFGVYGLSLKQLGTWRHGDPDAAPMYSDIFLAGCFSGAVQAIPAAPIELVKVKLMCQTGRQGIYTGPLQCLRSIYRNHGMRGCFRGLTATGMREVPGLSVYITTYTYLCDQMISDGHEHCSVRASLFAGGMAGMLSWTVNLPIDIVKSRLQADDLSKPRYSGMFHCAKEVFKEAGLKAFWRGLPVVCLRAFPVNAVTFAVYSVSLRYFNALSEESKSLNLLD